MRIVFWGTYDTGKPRVRILLRGLKESGVDVIECHKTVWKDIEDKSQLKNPFKKAFIFLKWIFSYPSLIFQYLSAPSHDLVFIGYIGHLDVIIIKFFAWLRGAPVVWDAFLSIYNTVVEDRKIVAKNSIAAKLLWLFESTACKFANYVLLDTQAHANYFKRTFSLPEEKINSVLVGAEPEFFQHNQESNQLYKGKKAPIILFYGQFIPLHGIDTIIKAAKAAQNEHIEWVIIGRGQESERIKALIGPDPMPNLKWIPWVKYDELSQWIRKASVCLGIFGNTEKANMVIPNKIFQILMCGKPVITRDSTAIRELLKPGQPGVWLVPPADPDSLLKAVREAVESVADVEYHSKIQNRIIPIAIGDETRQLLKHDVIDPALKNFDHAA
jgi:glycosyltransferase involved in cell wall biosynthesis